MSLKTLTIVLIFHSILIFSCTDDGGKGQNGSVLPAFKLGTMDGSSIDFNSFAGKVLVVDFWATWCQPCIYEIPHYNALEKKYGGQNFAMVGITMDSGDIRTVADFAKQNGIEYPIYMGTPTATMAVGGVEGYPKTFLFDQAGNVVKSFLGVHPDKAAEIDKLVGRMLASEDTPK